MEAVGKMTTRAFGWSLLAILVAGCSREQPVAPLPETRVESKSNDADHPVSSPKKRVPVRPNAPVRANVTPEPGKIVLPSAVVVSGVHTTQTASGVAVAIPSPTQSPTPDPAGTVSSEEIPLGEARMDPPQINKGVTGKVVIRAANSAGARVMVRNSDEAATLNPQTRGDRELVFTDGKAFNDLSAGKWELLLVRPDGSTAALPGGFTVVAPPPAPAPPADR
jgi:hypothetical protein